MHCSGIPHDKISGRSVGLELTLDDFQKVSDKVPFLADLKPSGKYVMEDVHKVCIFDTSFSTFSLLLLNLSWDVFWEFDLFNWCYTMLLFS